MSVRKWRRRWGGLAVTAVLSAAVAGFAVVAFEHWDAAQGDSAVGSINPVRPVEVVDAQTQAPPASVPMAVAALQAPPEPPAKVQDSLSVAPEPEPVFEDVELEAPYLIVDGHRFTAGRWAITLKDITAPHRDAICLDKDGMLFACGLQARAALNNLLRKGKATCHVRLPPIYGRFESTCQVADGDLAAAMVAQGWARPVAEAEDRLTAAMETARKAEAGLWNGGWRLRTAAPVP
jgi:endonuclease YncB( thermonuclease family)